MSRQAQRLSLTQKLQLNMQLATSIRVLHLDATGLTRYLEEEAKTNPHITLTPNAPEATPWLPRWTAAFAAHNTGALHGVDMGALLQNPALGLIAHVTQQISQVTRTPQERDIALSFMQALEPSGWLGRPLGPLAKEAGCSLEEAGQVLARLQGMEPTGLFARSLSECLVLQAKEADVYDRVMACIIENLDLLAEGRFSALAKICGVEQEEITQRLRIIRGFDPKPGAQFGIVSAPVREPDLMVTRSRAGWRVSINRAALPDVTVTARSPSDPVALTKARELLRAVNSRSQTLLLIGQEVLARQEAVLSLGMEALMPMGMQDVADALGLHISTVSRAVAGVSVDTPRGTIWLRPLFTEAVGGEAAGAIRAHLQRLIQQEDTRAPLSDQALADALSEKAGPIARRTVAKYRGMLNIPPAHRRKRIKLT
ncbi:RNA polymerase factor sigma-54 (plasmid) [Pseudorhodobacter turbinis]|uniref:RNA polymerase sigma-54 factor n=1 Tax=Pseudorhodobacter turbinis TaxID=2500533 RepID=A0A4P8EL14_9RHOB|nr:RNA polymerase factor sigma-54 [Pseudorhodobacter turbinis]QCO57475.1 RNA polymerase factor sigma-54 [Pseudorhodobacter turbinis]